MVPCDSRHRTAPREGGSLNFVSLHQIYERWFVVFISNTNYGVKNFIGHNYLAPKPWRKRFYASPFTSLYSRTTSLIFHLRELHPCPRVSAPRVLPSSSARSP